MESKEVGEGGVRAGQEGAQREKRNPFIFVTSR